MVVIIRFLRWNIFLFKISHLFGLGLYLIIIQIVITTSDQFKLL